MSSYRQPPPQSQRPAHLGTATDAGAPMDEDYDYKAASPRESATSPAEVNTDEALMDLAQLEELHVEAEKMKALGNKHMAAQVREL